MPCISDAVGWQLGRLTVGYEASAFMIWHLSVSASQTNFHKHHKYIKWQLGRLTVGCEARQIIPPITCLPPLPSWWCTDAYCICNVLHLHICIYAVCNIKYKMCNTQYASYYLSSNSGANPDPYKYKAAIWWKDIWQLHCTWVPLPVLSRFGSENI